jgi:glycosyltransferase involved in cell wall biosynthesis
MHKILVLTSTFPRWESDTEPPFVFELCKQLSKKFEVYVLAPHCEGSLDNEVMQGLRVARFRYFFEPYENLCYQGGMLAKLKEQRLRYLLIPFFLFFQMCAAYKLIKRENIALIHAHWIIPQGITACAIKLLSRKPVKILCTSHGGDLFSLKGNIARFVKRNILQSADGITVVNSVMKQEVYALCSPQTPIVEIIPMGVDLQTFTPATKKQRPFSLLFVGRLVEKKGLAYLINALPKIVQTYPETTLTIIGTGPLKEGLEHLVQEQQLNHKVIFLGSIPNTELPLHYQQHQIAVFPFIVADNGDREGLPVVVSEAIACGGCVITTDLPGLYDIANNNQGILIVPQKNSQAITDTVLDLFNEPDKIKHHSKTAFKNIKEKQSWGVIGIHYVDLIHRLTDPIPTNGEL